MSVRESVWDYPRPPALRRCTERVRIVLGGVTVCDADACWQVLETSHPPTYYLPRTQFVEGALVPVEGRSFCEWKGEACYLDVVGGGKVAARSGWYYPTPNPTFQVLIDHVAVYAGPMDACYVGDEQVTPQPGGFYGGWITSSVIGPFKGGPGSAGW